MSRPASCPSVFPLALGFIALALVSAACAPKTPSAPAIPPGSTKLGIDALFESHLDLFRGKKVGLITNPSGINSRLVSTADLFAKSGDIDLVALYGPEHGVRGNAQAGEYVPFFTDARYGLPVFSLYGQSMKPEAGMLRDIDAYMRSFDTTAVGKAPDGEMVRGIDIMVYDIQDVGSRVYTYVSTMAYAMQACAESGIPFVVLDRPNPINGVDIEGTILDYPASSSPVGLYPVPARHGMTVGELARLFNDRFLSPKADLTVIPMKNWARAFWYDETGLPWVYPSPNMPTLDTATVYPGLVYLEGTNVSEGRGTTRPFELLGAPWIDGALLTQRLNGLALPGVLFREAWFTPSFSKHQGRLCGGTQVHVTDRSKFRSVATLLSVVKTLRNEYPGQFRFYPEYFDKVMGGPRVREALEKGRSTEEILTGMEAGLEEFRALRKPYLLYD